MKRLSCFFTLFGIGSIAMVSGCIPEILGPIDYNVQYFEAGGADCLEGKLLYFEALPGDTARYRRLVGEQTTLPVAPNGHPRIDFTQSDPFKLVFPSGIRYGDETYEVLYIGSDGAISLGGVGTGNDSLRQHFLSVQVSVLPLNARATGSSVLYSATQNDIVVTYMDVGGTTAQCQFMRMGDGYWDIALSYPVVGTTRGGVVGLPKPPYLDHSLVTFNVDAFVAQLIKSNLCASPAR